MQNEHAINANAYGLRDAIKCKERKEKNRPKEELKCQNLQKINSYC